MGPSIPTSGEPGRGGDPLTVPADAAGRRLDHFLSERLNLSRSQIKNLIDEGRAEINGRVAAKAGVALRPGDVVTAAPVERPAERLEAQPIPLLLLHEDPHLLVLDKPPGLVVHPGAGNPDHTLVNALLTDRPELRVLPRQGIVHRLDKDTSGVMVVARTEAARVHLSAQFARHSVDRMYRALCVGRLAARSGRVEGLIARHPKDRKKFHLSQGRGRTSVTDYEVEKEYAHFSLVRLTLHTGRTHQIRVHMASLGHPVVGDPVYGSGASRRPSGRGETGRVFALARRQMLHAFHLGFDHPVTGERMIFSTGLPEDLRTVLDWLDRGGGT